MNTILHIDSSIRGENSVSTSISRKLVERIDETENNRVTYRDVSSSLPLIDDAWANANFTPEEDRSEEQNQILALSDTLIEEVMIANTIVIGLPIYNFNVPVGFKAWMDLIARARKTFQYTENGPEGLLKDKKVYLVVASGGTPVGSEYDFASHYAKYMFNFMGITDITILAADSRDKSDEDVLATVNESVKKAKAA